MSWKEELKVGDIVFVVNRRVRGWPEPTVVICKYRLVSRVPQGPVFVPSSQISVPDSECVEEHLEKIRKEIEDRVKEYESMARSWNADLLVTVPMQAKASMDAQERIYMDYIHIFKTYESAKVSALAYLNEKRIRIEDLMGAIRSEGF